MKTKQEIIDEILESGAKYVTTSISSEACAVAIAIRDIKDVDSRFIDIGIEWEECSSGLDEGDY